MPQNNEIFDRKLLSERRARALQRKNYPSFLDRIIATELVNRLDLLNRQFKTAVLLTPASDVFLQEISKSEKIGNWICAMPSGAEPVSRCDVVDLAFDCEWLPFKENSVDCFIAGPGFELVNDLPGVLAQSNRALKPDGLFLGAMFGGQTLSELAYAWMVAEERQRGGASPRVAPFGDVRQVGDLLTRAGFGLPVCDSDRFVVRYDDALSLMAEIKAMGQTSSLLKRSRKFTTKKLLACVNQIYRENFSDNDKRVRASVEINYLTAWSPHENQQKPLKPGSAKRSLASVLQALKPEN